MINFNGQYLINKQLTSKPLKKIETQYLRASLCILFKESV
jgi:hypothetical protein